MAPFATAPAAGAGFDSPTMSTAEFTQRFPAAATSRAIQVARAAGKQAPTAQDVITTMHSDTYQSRLAGQREDVQQGKDDRAIARISRIAPAPVANFDPKADPMTEMSQGYNQKAAAIGQDRTSQSVYLGALNDENRRLGRLATFDKEAYTTHRLAEMQPTADIDKAILDLRNRALFSKAAMFEEVKDLPFALQQQVIASRMKTFTDQIDDYSTLREARVSAAKDKITEEVGSYEGKINASKTRIEGLKTALDIMKGLGASDADIAQLRIDHAKELQSLQKARKGSGNGQLTTSEEIITNALVQKYIKEHGGSNPAGDDLAEIRRQAKFISKNKPDVAGDVAAAGGEYSQLPSRGPESETTMQTFGKDVPWSIWHPFTRGEQSFQAPITTTRQRNALDDYGVPVSKEEKLRLLKMATDAAK